VSDGSIDELLDRAVAAINRGDRATATALAGQVLAVDHGNVDAEDLLTAPGSAGEIRRLTIVFADLVDSTALSTAVEPETYRTLVGRYREQVRAIVDRFEGHIGSMSGDGMLAVFGHPRAHEDDVRRAVAAGLEITRAVSELSDQAQRRIGIEITVRVGVHRGLVYPPGHRPRRRVRVGREPRGPGVGPGPAWDGGGLGCGRPADHCPFHPGGPAACGGQGSSRAGRLPPGGRRVA